MPENFHMGNSPVRFTTTEVTHFVLLALASALVLFADASIKELHGTAVFYASLVREIVDSGNPMLIYTDDRAYFIKPPLVLWTSAAVSKVFGLTNFSVTLTSRLAGVGVILLTYILVRRWWSHPVAWLSALAVLTNSTFVQFTATMRMDSLMMLGFLLTLNGWFYRRASWGPAALFGGVTIAVLSKGPLGFAAVPLIVLHAWLLGAQQPLERRQWRWAILLLPIVVWYGTLVALHGLRPFTEFGIDTLRVSAAPHLNVWQSIVDEYLIKPARRYWPWLPFMVWGGIITVRHVFDRSSRREARMNSLWLLIWLAVVFIGSALKPDHDIRYLYPAIPVLGLMAAVAIASLTRDRLHYSVPFIILIAIVGILLLQRDERLHTDNRNTIAAIRAELAAPPQTLAIGGFPVRLEQPRRQNTHRDWVHFYTGSAPEVLSWDQVRRNPPSFAAGVFMTNSRGHVERLAEFGLHAKYVTTEMIFAVPK